jgi:hypothetical protein
MKKLLLIVLFLTAMAPVAALTSDTLVKFKGGIGVIPVSSVAGNASATGTFSDVNRNTVRTVDPPGQPWTIADLKARVKVDGSIKVDGKGLLLAGGNGIGTNANQRVFATLICDAAAPFTLHNSNLNGVPLERDGDFHIDDILSPPPPTDCASPVLLIRNVGGTWFAAGIVDRDSKD